MIKIAFCDDDMEVLHQMNELLDSYRVERNEDITYAAFQSPFELLTEIEKGIRPDILFLDVVMPGQNGMDVAKISDTRGKGMCKNPDYVEYLQRCINWRMENDK